MSSGGPAGHGLLRGWIAVLSMIVPRASRARWREEWLAEITHGLRPDWRPPGGFPGLAAGILRDALTVRRPMLREAAGRPRLPGFGARVAFRLGFRSLVADPVPTAAAVLALSLAIGAGVSIFTIVDAVLMRPLPYTHSERLVNLWTNGPGDGLPAELRVAPAQAQMLLEESRVFDSIALSRPDSWVLNIEANPAPITALRVNSAYLRILGAEPALGRLFSPANDRGELPVQAILTHGLWRDQFGSDPDIIGKTIVVNYVGRAEIVGVLPTGFVVDLEMFGDPQFSRGATVQAFFSLPLRQRPEDEAGAWNAGVFTAVALLGEGVSLQQAQYAVDGLADRMAAVGNQALSAAGFDSPERRWDTRLVPVFDQVVRDAKPSLLLLVGAIALVLILACANVANLMIGRASLRTKEVAVHTALGAHRRHVLLRFFSESVLTSAASALIGLGLAVLAIDAALSLGPQIQLPRLREIGIDWHAYFAAVGLASFAALASGLVPAMRMSSMPINVALKDTGDRPLGAGLRRRVDLPSALVVAEVALSVALLIGVALLVRSFVAINGVAPGFDRQHTLSFRAYFPQFYRGGADSEALAAAVRTIEERLAAIPGVEAVATASDVPFSYRNGLDSVKLEGQDPTPVVLDYVGPSFLEVMGVPVLAGRGFRDSEHEAASKAAAIVDEGLAQAFESVQDTVGKSLDLGWDRPLEIVGVVGSVRDGSLERTPERRVYVPTRFGGHPPYFVVRTATDPAGVAGSVREVVRGIDPEIMVADLSTTEDRLGATLGMRRASNLLLLVLVAIGAVLAVVGVYAVVTDRVNQAHHEIGVRLAIGATSGSVVRMILTYSGLLAGVGATAGLILATVLARFLTSLLYGVSAFDAATYLAAALLLVLAAVLAAVAPARSAARIDPVRTLRQI